MCDATKVWLRGRFVALNMYIRKEIWYQINNPSFSLKKLLKNKNKPKASNNAKVKKKKIHEITTKKQEEKIINKTKCWFFEKIKNMRKLWQDGRKNVKKKTSYQHEESKKGPTLKDNYIRTTTGHSTHTNSTT